MSFKNSDWTTANSMFHEMELWKGGGVEGGGCLVRKEFKNGDILTISGGLKGHVI